MRERGEPPGRIGLVADRTNPMWEEMVVEPRYRCLIALTHFGNPDGTPGATTRTWFSVKDQPIMSCARFCRNLPDHGPVYAGMTLGPNAAVMLTHDRLLVTREEGKRVESGKRAYASVNPGGHRITQKTNNRP